MGVDAGIFAKKAKKYFWFDRLSNIEEFWQLPDSPEKSETITNLSKIKDSLREKDNQLTAVEIISFLKVNIYAWLQGDPERHYHTKNIEGMIEFINAHPGDQFFVADDHNDAHDLIGNMHGERGPWRGEYMEWKP